MTYRTLISTADFDTHINDPNWAVIDCRSQLKDHDYGRRAYEQGHIAGAVFADFEHDLSGEIIPGKTGRHPLPPIEKVAQKFSEWGIDNTVQVVAYDAAGGASSAGRLWWMLRWLGHEQVAVLDGGWQKWEREGRSIRSGIEQRRPRTFVPHVRPELVITADDVLDAIGKPSLRLFDARAAERYRGENETIDPIAGHIPGAISAPYMDNLDESGQFKSVDELRTQYSQLLNGLPASQAAFYCGSGGTAPHNILAMLHAGLGEAKLYAGSWSDWILDPNRPIHIGDEPA